MVGPEGRVRPQSGLCFGSRFLDGEGVRLLEILPRTSFSRVCNCADFWLAWLIDICAAHADNRQAIFVEDARGWLHGYFVDHGHLFGGPKGEHRFHFRASRYLDPRIYLHVPSHLTHNLLAVAANLNVDQLWRKIQTLPEDWKTTTALYGFTECLSVLSSPRLLQGAIESMMNADEQFNESKPRGYESQRKFPKAVLRAGVQAKALECCVCGHGALHSARTEG